MKTMRWIAVIAAATWCVGSGPTGASDQKPTRADTRGEDKAPHADQHGPTHAKGEHKAEHHKVNINEASKADLMTLDGISSGVAQEIITYRQAHGPFKRAHDLEKVAGVSKDVLEKNAGRITVK
jgi:competence ComEA-like helix-hairpin-helix protein